MKPSLRWLYLVALTCLLLDPCGLSGKSRTVATTRVELTVFEVGNLPQTSDCSVERESDGSEKKTLKADQHRQALLLLQMAHAAALAAPELKVFGVLPGTLPVFRTEALGEEHLIRGPPALG